MGLDMYLFRKDLCRVEKEGGEVYYSKFVTDGLDNFDEIPGAEVAYWRKANHIHAWFVKNVQNGTDDCGYYIVQPQQLQKLVEGCKQVLATPEDAPHVLPTQGGFFFGGLDYDEYYTQDCEKTIEQIEKAMKEAPENAEFLYHSSW